MGSSRFSDGFLLGAVAGGALVFLLGTKKGNEVLKIVMEEGRASLGDLMDEIEEYREESQATQAEETKVNQSAEKKADSGKSDNVKEEEAKKPTKRFFKKSK